jgi:hypothetical protein
MSIGTILNRLQSVFNRGAEDRQVDRPAAVKRLAAARTRLAKEGDLPARRVQAAVAEVHRLDREYAEAIAHQRQLHAEAIGLAHVLQAAVDREETFLIKSASEDIEDMWHVLQEMKSATQAALRTDSAKSYSDDGPDHSSPVFRQVTERTSNRAAVAARREAIARGIVACETMKLEILTDDQVVARLRDVLLSIPKLETLDVMQKA